MKTKIVLLFSLLLIVNSGVYFWLLPFIQKSVNAHTTSADFCIILFFISTIVFFLMAFYNFLNRQYNVFAFGLLVLGMNLILWVPRILSIECKSCSMA
ncbi:hypothetical protein [Flavobacterium sp.]|uniref:hypothetical protein n=1 Tax=Flavobacterium sp. TaxID=239 RepID=UPI0028BED245|nr:hypothetical protein [Flavobacterium sp.]